MFNQIITISRIPVLNFILPFTLHHGEHLEIIGDCKVERIAFVYICLCVVTRKRKLL